MPRMTASFLPRLMVLTFSVSAAVALLLTAAVRELPLLGDNLVYSLFIGLSITALSLGMERTPWLAGRSPVQRSLLALAVASPLGYLAGTVLARVVLGHPLLGSARVAGHPAAMVATAVATMAVGGLIWHLSRLAAEATAREHAQRLAVEAELRSLRSQLDPHLLFNTIAHLRSLIEEDAGSALRMVDCLVPYLRQTLAGTRSEMTTLTQEFERLGLYLELLALRLGPRLTWALDLPAELARRELPSMLLQPLVENAVQHGVQLRSGPARVEVRARTQGDALVLAVVDSSAAAVDHSSVRSGTGFGLPHVRQRLAAHYGHNAHLELQATLHGSTAIIHIRP